VHRFVWVHRTYTWYVMTEFEYLTNESKLSENTVINIVLSFL